LKSVESVTGSSMHYLRIVLKVLILKSF